MTPGLLGAALACRELGADMSSRGLGGTALGGLRVGKLRVGLAGPSKLGLGLSLAALAEEKGWGCESGDE